MAEKPALIDGFLRALCGISNGMYREGGMSCTYHHDVTPPPNAPSGSPSQAMLLGQFFDVALGSYSTPEPSMRDELVQELLQVVREASGAELVAACVDNNSSEIDNTLTLWWKSETGMLDSAVLFWSID